MQFTYDKALAQVFKDEGGYTNEATDPGGPTNWGITIHDARQYWKPSATAEDVKNMPKSIAEAIYQKHYADPILYNDLPAGVDYTILDYAINSGISKAVKTAQTIVGVPVDGVMGPITLAKIKEYDAVSLINAIYQDRINFLKTLHTWSTYGHGWTNRCNNGRNLAVALALENAPRIKRETWLQLLIQSISKLLSPQTKGN